MNAPGRAVALAVADGGRGADAGAGAAAARGDRGRGSATAPQNLTLGAPRRSSVRNLGPEPSESAFTAGRAASVRKLGVGRRGRAQVAAPPPIPEGMSIDAVVGRIDQIVAMQQQLADPCSPTGTSGSSAETDRRVRRSATGSTPTSFSDALSSALGHHWRLAVTRPLAGLADGLGDGNGPTGALTSALTSVLAAPAGDEPLGTRLDLDRTGAPAQVQAMTNMANSLVGKPYVYGGGHGGWGPQSGYDCSGFVSAVLHAGGYLSQPVDTTALPQQAGMEAGPGQYVTVYDRALAGPERPRDHRDQRPVLRVGRLARRVGRWRWRREDRHAVGVVPGRRSRPCCTPPASRRLARSDRPAHGHDRAQRHPPGRSPSRAGRRTWRRPAAAAAAWSE